MRYLQYQLTKSGGNALKSAQIIMANMSYCRFENTYKDLIDCYDALREAGGAVVLSEDAGQYENPISKNCLNYAKT